MFACLLCLVLALPHGGQFQPPLDPEDPEAPPAYTTQPGTGPVPAFAPDRWEWWFDFNQEELIRLRERMRTRSTPQAEPPFKELDDETRLRRVLPALVAALRDPVRDVRATSAMSLGRLRLPGSLPYLLAMLGDRDLFVRIHTILALGVSEQPGAVEPLSDILDDAGRSTEARLFAAAALGLCRQPEAETLLARHLSLKALREQSSRLRWGLVYAAGVSGSGQLVAPLLALRGSWLWKQDADLRGLVAVALGRMGSPESVPALLDLLEDQDNQVRRSAAAGLEGCARFLADEQVAELVDLVTTENDLPARINLLRALADTHSRRAGAALRERLAHCTTLLRPHVALALGLHGDAASAAPLLESLEQQHETSTRAAVALALGLLGAEQARPSLEQLLPRAGDPLLAGYVALALGLLDDQDPALLDQLADMAGKSHDIELVRLAGSALGLLGARTRLRVLTQGLADPALGSMDQAARAYTLGLVGDARQLDALLALASSDERPSYVVRYAVGALGDLADPRDLPPAWRLSRHVELNQEMDLLLELYRVL